MLQLKLNGQVVKEYSGKNNELVPKLMKEGKVPISVAGLMQKRLEVLTNTSDKVKSAWWNNYFNTGDGIFYHPDGNVKVVLGAKPIRDMNSKSKLYSGALVLGEDRDSSISVYESLNGEEFKRKDLESQIGNLLSKDAVKKHPVWNALVPDKSLLNEYVDAAFDQGKSYNHDDMMNVSISSPCNMATGRLWFISNVYDYSSAYGYLNIDSRFGRLAGVEPEALNMQDKGLPNSININGDVHNYLVDSMMVERAIKRSLKDTVQKPL